MSLATLQDGNPRATWRCDVCRLLPVCRVYSEVRVNFSLSRESVTLFCKQDCKRKTVFCFIYTCRKRVYRRPLLIVQCTSAEVYVWRPILFNYVETCKSHGEALSDIQYVFCCSVPALFGTCSAAININRIRLKNAQKCMWVFIKNGRWTCTI
jgi:hypothetical protein